MLAVDFHCHGTGDFDMSHPDEVDLERVDELLKVEGVAAVQVFSLPQGELESFERLMDDYATARRHGRLTNIVGIAIEGPLLALVGGTPEDGCWTPTQEQWRRIAALGPKGLIFSVISPDSEVGSGDAYPTDMNWIMRTLSEQGVMPALGHFNKDDPERTARTIDTICENLAAAGLGPVVTDHMFNDMPINFKHSWRMKEERATRSSVLSKILADDWTPSNMDQKLGPVPSAIVRQAHKGNLKVCINFDGDHVDIEICRKTIALLGAENILLMTDRIACKRFGGRLLHSCPDNTLLYQDQGIVAGGTQQVTSQIGNMLRAGIDGAEIYQIAFMNPHRLLDRLPIPSPVLVPARETTE